MTVAELFAKLSLKIDKSSFDLAERALMGLKTAVVGFVAYAGVNFLKGMIQNTVEAGSAASDMAQRTGIAAETLQGFGYAADLSGSSMGGLSTGFRGLAKTIEGVKNGSKEARKAFHDLGISANDPAVKAGKLDEVLLKVADKFKDLPNGQQKYALAMRVFGKSGAELIPMLNEGSEGIAKMRQEAIDLGVVIDNETADSLEAFGDEQDRVKAAFTGIRNEVVRALLPGLRSLAQGMLTWIKANREVIRQKLQTVIKGLIVVVKALGVAFSLAAKAFGFLVDNWKLALVVIASVTTAVALLGASSIAAGIASAAAWLAALWPLALVALAVGAIIIVLEDLYVALNGGDAVFTRVFGKENVQKLRDFIRAFVEWGSTAKEIFKVSFGVMNGQLRVTWALLKNVYQTLKYIVDLADDVVGKDNKLISAVKNFAKSSKTLGNARGVGSGSVSFGPGGFIPTFGGDQGSANLLEIAQQGAGVPVVPHASGGINANVTQNITVTGTPESTAYSIASQIHNMTKDLLNDQARQIANAAGGRAKR